MTKRNTPAFVPEAEQPYQIPQNWRWATLGAINRYCPHTIDPATQPDAYFELYSVPSVERGYPEIIPGSEIGSTKQAVQKNDVLLCKINPRINRIWKVSKHTDYPLLASSEWIVIRNNQMNPDFMLYYLRSPLFREFMLSHVVGVGGSLMRAQPKHVKQYPIPVPPLAEQQRIVDRIESLFTKLDAARDNAQAVFDGFEMRKAAILHRAFSGKLTEQWRKNRNYDSDSWKMLRFADVAEVKSNLVNPLDFPKYPHIAPDNIEKKTGVLLPYRTVSEDGVKSAKHLFHAGQILYSKIRPYLSKVVIIDFDGLCSADMYPVEPKEGFDAFYLWYYMLSDEFLYQASTAGSRSLLPKINQKELSSINIRVTDIDEQREIVAVLNRFFDKERHVKNLAEQTIMRIDAMKKAILGRAFRGELGANDPSEESPEAMLRNLL